MPTIIDILREKAKGKQPAQATAAPSFDAASVRRLVQMDQGLPAKAKARLMDELNDVDVLDQLRAGSLGAVITMLTTKYLRLKPSTQLLLSIAGFGLGKIIHDYRNSPKFAPYNSQTKMYEISD